MKEELLKVKGAKEHNLKNVSVDIPKNKLIVITGLSGKNKTTKTRRSRGSLKKKMSRRKRR